MGKFLHLHRFVRYYYYYYYYDFRPTNPIG